MSRRRSEMVSGLGGAAAPSRVGRRRTFHIHAAAGCSARNAWMRAPLCISQSALLTLRTAAFYASNDVVRCSRLSRRRRAPQAERFTRGSGVATLRCYRRSTLVFCSFSTCLVSRALGSRGAMFAPLYLLEYSNVHINSPPPTYANSKARLAMRCHISVCFFRGGEA